MNKLEKVALNPHRPVLTPEQQIEVFNTARLVLRLSAPKDLFDADTNEQLRKQQTQKIKDFADLLHEHLVTELGSVIIAVYPCAPFSTYSMSTNLKSNLEERNNENQDQPYRKTDACSPNCR